jgi:hypothetical protein
LPRGRPCCEIIAPRRNKTLVDLIRRADPGAVVGVKGHIGEDVILGLVHGPGKAGEARAKAVGDLTPLPSWVKTVRLAAATKARCPGPTRASRLRRTWIRHLCQVVRPSCASEITSCTPRGPRRVRRKVDRGPNPGSIGLERLGLGAPEAVGLRRPPVVHGGPSG